MNNYEVIDEMTIDKNYCDLTRSTDVTTKITLPEPTVSVGVRWTF